MARRLTHARLLGAAAAAGAILASACSIFATRPTQEMSDTVAALRAAKEVQADTLAPELYRQAGEWFFKAKNEYRYKNFADARSHAEKARKLAEQAEFEAIRGGGSRTEVGGIADPLANMQAPPPPVETSTPAKPEKPYEYPTPTGTPYNENGPNTPQAPGPGPNSAPNPLGTPRQ
jgi:hypothetical protein